MRFLSRSIARMCRRCPRGNVKSMWVAVIATCVLANISFSQQTKEVDIEVNDLSVKHQQSPDFSGINFNLRRHYKQPWLLVVMQYTPTVENGDWIDKLEFDWNVAFSTEEDRPVVMQTSVTYRDVEEGRRRYAMAFVRPEIIRRYYGRTRVREGNLRVYVAIKPEGSSQINYLHPQDESAHQRRWWELGEPRVIRRDDGLLPRNETPFAPLNYDSLEFIERESR